MSILPNGTVLPHGLLDVHSYDSSIAGFNRSFRNTGLKAGYIVRSYSVNDPDNVYKLCTEYDVQTIEQDENKGSTAIFYRHCLSSQGFGSIADFLEFNLRSQTYQSQNSPSFDNQDGAIVLIKCLDNIGSKAIVMGNLCHPDRPTTLQSTDPQLAGAYNGINFAINPDGSFSITFKGATDNQGIPANPSLNTALQIMADGSFQFNNPSVTIQGNASGTLTITTTGDANITTQGKTTITATGDLTATTQANANVTASGNAVVQGSSIQLNGSAGEVLTTKSQPVIDSIFGEISVGVPSVQAGN